MILDGSRNNFVYGVYFSMDVSIDINIRNTFLEDLFDNFGLILLFFSTFSSQTF